MTYSRFDLQAVHGNNGQLIRGMALVSVTDVQLPIVLDGVWVAEVGFRVGYARRAVEHRGADKEDFAEHVLARLADGDGQR